jgi:Carboxypeptidase regulatory-like domain
MIRIGGVPVTYPFAWVSTAFPLISRTFRRHFGVLGSIVAVATLLLVAVLPLAVVPGASAQSQFATLSGTVTDSSGAIVSGAAVTLKYSASGETRKTVTNDDGFFSVPTLPAGTYDVTVETQGFQTWHGRNIVLNGADSRTMKIEMKVGAVSERIEVQAAYDLVTIDSGEKSALISSEELQHLSLVGRNASEFIKILPGATLAANNGINKSAYSGEVVGINGFCAGNGCNAGGLSSANINGQAVGITQDGQNTFDPGAFGAATPVNPNPNMISEVKVLTSNFTSENPKGPVVVNTVTKPGGSTFHGEAYIFARNHVMNSNDHFNNDTRVGQPKPNDSYYYPGGNIGGPLIIPGTGFNRSRRKVFFFEGFEYYDQHLDGGVDRAVVPTAAMLNGDFSAFNGTSGKSGRDALGNQIAAPAAGTSLGFDQRAAAGCTISGGVMSSACIDPNALALIKTISPAANADPATHQGFNYVQQFAAPQTSWQNVVRGDWNISDNTKVYLTWSRQRETANMPTGLWVGAGDWAVPTPTTTIGANGSDSTTATLLHVFSPTMTVEGRFGYTKINFPSSPQDISKVLRKDTGFPLTGIFSNSNIPAVLSWGDSIPNFGDVGHDYHPTMIANKGIPSAAVNLTKIYKTHTTKYGFYYEHVYNKQDNWGQYMGVFQYASWAGSPTGNIYSDMLMGIGQAGYFEQALPPPSNLSQNIAAFYAQDDWKLTRRITIQYGMRFEHYAKPYSPGLGLAVFDPGLYASSASSVENPGVVWHGTDAAVPLSGTQSRFLFFSPRVGAAIDIFGNGKTVLRGGWGKYRAYDSVQSNAYTGPAQTALGSVTWTCGSNDPLCPTWEAIDTHAFTPVFGHPSLQGTGFSVTTPHNEEQPLTTSYSVSIDQQLPAKFRLELSYVGNYTQFLQGTVNLNSVPIGTLTAPGFTCPTGNITDASCQQTVRPFQKYQTMTGAVTAGGSQFDSFQASLHRNVGFLTLQANYTFSKALGDGVAVNNGGLTGALPDYGAHWLWGVLPFDRAHALSMAYVFALPKIKGGNAFLRGAASDWEISGITQVESGAQLTAQSGTSLNFNYTGPVSNVQALGTPDITLYPLITCNPTSGLKHNQFVNPNCFAPAPVGSLGTGGMPYMAGPMFWNSDLSLLKTFRITERQGLQFRFSAFNFLNHGLLSFTNGDSNLKLNFPKGSNVTSNANPANPNDAFGVANYHIGRRILELGLKYSF